MNIAASCRLDRASNQVLWFRATRLTSSTGAKPWSSTTAMRSPTACPSWSTTRTRRSGRRRSWSFLPPRCFDARLLSRTLLRPEAWRRLDPADVSTAPSFALWRNNLFLGFLLGSPLGSSPTRVPSIRRCRKFRDVATNGPLPSSCEATATTWPHRNIPDLEIRLATTPTRASTFLRWKKILTKLFFSTATVKCRLAIGDQKIKHWL